MIEKVRVHNYEAILDLDRNEPKLFAVKRLNQVILASSFDDADVSELGKLLYDWFKQSNVSCSLDLRLHSHYKLLEANQDLWLDLPFILTHTFHDSSLNERTVKVKGILNILHYRYNESSPVKLR